MSEGIAIIAAGLGLYPLLVLIIAITGPHNETEIRERSQANDPDA